MEELLLCVLVFSLLGLELGVLAWWNHPDGYEGSSWICTGDMLQARRSPPTISVRRSVSKSREEAEGGEGREEPQDVVRCRGSGARHNEGVLIC